jgi:hypothetical protein
MKLYTYLNYGGYCEQAFRFYEQHLGGTITMMTQGQVRHLLDDPPRTPQAAERLKKCEMCVRSKRGPATPRNRNWPPVQFHHSFAVLMSTRNARALMSAPPSNRSGSGLCGAR